MQNRVYVIASVFVTTPLSDWLDTKDGRVARYTEDGVPKI